MKPKSVGKPVERPDKELWRVAVHEAAHWIFSEWAGVGNVEFVTILPIGESLGTTVWARWASYTPHAVRMAIMMLAAGRAAEEILTGNRCFIDGTDFQRACELAGDDEVEATTIIVQAFFEVQEYIRTTLYVPILTAASLLFEAKIIGREDARGIWFCVQPDEQPWLLPTTAANGKGLNE